MFPDFNLDYGNKNMIYYNDVMFFRQLDIDEGEIVFGIFCKNLAKNVLMREENLPKGKGCKK